MSEVTLEERGRALENQFYEKENAEKLSAIKTKLDSQGTKEALRKASGMTDDAVLEKLVTLGLRSNTIAALSLPLCVISPVFPGTRSSTTSRDWEKVATFR